jgi:FkbM family methyltransferase
VTDDIFQSFAQNGEDVILWRALGHIHHGRYIDVGANDPTWLSVSKAFYDHGWRGIAIEPSHHFAQLLREQRPEDLIVEAAASARGQGTVLLHEIQDSGLSTLVDEVRDQHVSQGWDVHEVEVATSSLNEILDAADWGGLDIHFMSVDVEGAEGDVLASIDLTRWRPWILVIESTAPLATNETHSRWESGVLGAGYEFCLFDGLSRYYVAQEHADQLRHDLSYSPCVFDSFQTHSQRALLKRLDEITADANRWRSVSLTDWSEVIASQQALVERVDHLAFELAAHQRTLSWRITAPLRLIRRRTSASS